MTALTLAEARALVEDAQRHAAELGKALSVAVVDYGGFPVLIERMDGARPLTPSIALAKAYSAAVMQRPTVMLKGWSDSDPVFFSQVARLGHQPIVATKGGYTLKRDGEILGGLGVSGGSPDEDQAICEAVVAAAGFSTDFPAWAGLAKRSGRPRSRRRAAMADDFKYHIDHHASLIPPPELAEARSAHARGELDAAGCGRPRTS